MFCREFGARTRERTMGERSGDSNGRPPRDRRDEALSKDSELKREVDEALREWDRLLEGNPPAPNAEPVRPGHA